MFDALFSLFAAPLRLFHDLTHSYVLAVILYAIVIKLLLFPFGIKQQKGMVKQAKMRPKEMAIRKRYAGRTDQKTQMKLNEDLQKLYQEEGYNPLSGCGPMLIQIPVVFILYQIIHNPLKYMLNIADDVINTVMKNAGALMGKTYNQISVLDVISSKWTELTEGFTVGEETYAAIEGLGEKAKLDELLSGFEVFGVNMAGVPGDALSAINAEGAKNWAEIITLLAIPVLVFLAQWISMKVVRKFSYQPAQDAQVASSMKIMDLVMPLMTLFFAFNFSGLLGIYWILNSVLSMIQQIILKKMYPIPVFTEEDYKAAEKAMNGKLKPAKKTSSGNKKKNPRSLHHIDDDDDEDEAPAPAPKKDKPKANPFIEPAKVKDEDNDDNEDKEGN